VLGRRSCPRECSPVFENLLPPDVVVVEAFGDVPGEGIFPGEEDLIADAVDSRRCEFVTARRCAREALATLGYAPAPIRMGSKREPLWPPGVVGSITHTTGFRAAAVAPKTICASVGIDAEQNLPLPDGVKDYITVAEESEMLAALARAAPCRQWARLLFCAKEAVYKAWYPLTGRWLDFTDARLTIDPAGTFTATLSIDGHRPDSAPELNQLHGRFLIAGDLIASAVTITLYR
jgi:4'-phosphopantetheinyl transferase EntD